MFKTILAAALIFIGLGTLFAQEEPGQHQDTSAGLPKEYADYLIASSTLSPDQKFAVIYPKTKLCPDEPKKGSLRLLTFGFAGSAQACDSVIKETK